MLKRLIVTKTSPIISYLGKDSSPTSAGPAVDFPGKILF